MKRVKFNLTTAVHMVPDEIYEARLEEFRKMRYEDPRKYREYIALGDEFPIINVKIGEIMEVPDWYYEKNKNITREVNNCVDWSKQDGKPVPYRSDEAARFGRETILKKTVKKLELVKGA